MTKKLKRFAGAAKSAAGAGAAAQAAFGQLKQFGQLGEQIGEKVAGITSQLGALAGQPSSKQVMDSAQQIWLAGLGAFAKAQTEGKKVFETLVAQGAVIEKNTRHVAEATIETAKEQASKTMHMASGKFDKLEQVFEDRVHKSLNRLGVLTAKDVEALAAQVTKLTDSVNLLLAQEKRTVAKKPVAAMKKATVKLAKKVVKKVAPKAKPTSKSAKKPAARRK